MSQNKPALSKIRIVIKCSNYQEMGHNERICKNLHVPQSVKVPSRNKGGRPCKKHKTIHAPGDEGGSTSNVPTETNTSIHEHPKSILAPLLVFFVTRCFSKHTTTRTRRKSATHIRKENTYKYRC